MQLKINCRHKKVSLALDGWISTYKPAIKSIMAYYMNRYWELHEIPLGFEEVDRVVFFGFER